MGYTGTTNYGFQKPAKENAFTVDDLNNALDKIDETINTKVSINQGAENTGKILVVNEEGFVEPSDKGVSVVQFNTPVLIHPYEIVDLDNNIFYFGDYLNKNAQFLLSIGSYKLIVYGNITQEIPFTISSVGITYVDLAQYICVITIDMSDIPYGTKIKGIPIPLDNVDSIAIIKFTGNYSIAFQSPDNGNEKEICDIPSVSIDASQSNVSISPTATGVFTVIESNTTLKMPKGSYRIITVGGGGGGSYGGLNGSLGYANGGGGGGSGRIADSTVQLEGTYAITIGAGGAAGSNTDNHTGKSGGATSFGTVLSSSGGDGGGNDTAYLNGRGQGGSGMAGGGGGGGASSSPSAPASGGDGGVGEFAGGGGGGGGQQYGSSHNGGNAAVGGTYGGRGGYGSNATSLAQNGVIATDSFYKGNYTTANGGSYKNLNSGGGGGGGYTADGGDAATTNNIGGGGGGGGCRGGNGGNGGTSYNNWASSGKGYGAGGGGRGYSGSSISGTGGGGGGGYGTSAGNTTGAGKSGCVVYMWMARQ